ncbi:MAG: polyphosphate kinase 2 [Campylobacter sp.]|uniref:polyphosphate kinase 2 n=1 Tax=Campylobacter sp. TaxID=205 RepID=UPI002A4D867B|nr:polyphosphate kinase 2 [Campylobacter sp.]MDD6925010.1 polyphosphate kinase 2 [Campylobacteraceae bacterium]MCI6818706.1 polyphosphate kinase 2 [Campylobacter sp.]MCI7075801.1 polyphosphate kinase 2 [Campylobacter sp.]MCI7104188.1 polyphosphate kinase 2 [Campylobacter sp.]MCI7361829.1 polyphosphate kinase 2 [Campylobacter sp.]
MSEEIKKDKESKYVTIKVKKKKLKYEKELEKLQIELLKLQSYIKEKGLKVLILTEGRDAAGKGGTIKRITEHLNPRGCRVVALEKPSDVERTQWYFQRYIKHLPSAGEIVIFDRSWYNRGGVEPVMGFCTNEEHNMFLRQVPKLEEMLVNSGIILFKFYFSVSKDEQKARFDSRKDDPLKQYKLSAVDQQSQILWEQYTLAKYSMLLASNTDFAPWTIIVSNDKKKARLNTIKSILARIDYPKKISKKELEVDEKLVKTGSQEIAIMAKTLRNEGLKKIEDKKK